MWEWVEPAGLLVQVAIAIGLVIYTLETWRLRRAAQEQNETMQKPCLVLLVRRREDIDIGADGVQSIPYPEERILDGEWSGTGHVALHNIGNGPAFNIRYKIQKQEPPFGSTEQGYLPYILRGNKEPVLQVPDNLGPGDGDKEVGFTMSYESHNGRRYESEIYTRRGRRRELIVTRCEFPTAGGLRSLREGRK